MTLRTKILLAQLPLAAALLVVGLAGALTAASLERRSDAAMRENYQSVLAAQRMLAALTAIDGAALMANSARGATALATIEPQVPRFEQALRTEEGNITEPGEREIVQRLRGNWDALQRELPAYRSLADRSAREVAYFDGLGPALGRAQQDVTAILDLNQDAMVRKTEAARRSAARANQLLLTSAIGCSILGMLASAVLIARLMRPLTVLGHAVRRLGQGDVKARARVSVRDEIGTLASDFNTMADHLEHYRTSSLGDLLIAQRQAQAVIDSLSDPVIVFGTNGEVLNVNAVAETTVKVKIESEDPLAGVDVAVRGGLERVRSHVLAGSGAYTPKGLDEAVRVLTADGERSFLPRATPLYSEEGAIMGVTIVLQDVTRLLRFDELRNDLVATVAHEFRTPLTSLRMALHLCTEGTVGPLGDKQADLLFAARDDCERLQRIVDDLLDLSRIQSGRIDLHLRRCSALALVEGALDPHRLATQDKGVRLRSEVLPGTGEILADPDRLGLVFTNLVSNAIRHTGAGDEIVVRALPAERGGVRFEVHDSGPGILPEHRAAIFEKFYRVPGAPAGGAGLGLYIAREIVQAHEGEIGFESEVGRGTTFWFRLPAAPEVAPA